MSEGRNDVAAQSVADDVGSAVLSGVPTVARYVEDVGRCAQLTRDESAALDQWAHIKLAAARKTQGGS